MPFYWFINWIEPMEYIIFAIANRKENWGKIGKSAI